MSNIYSTIACNLDSNILSATYPLFEQEKIEAVEWSFDTLFDIGPMPPWFEELLNEYSNEGRLVGHGVFFSIFNGKWTADQEKWIAHLSETSKQFQFNHITEHFGFMTGHNFHDGAPLSIPYTPSTLAIGIDRLSRIQQACNCPVGLENLAFAYHLNEVKRHGEFLFKLIEPLNGFIILDLHNLYCQMMNFDLDFESLISAYPLDRVREIHISGGSWEPSMLEPGRMIRRDTHNDSVPDEVFELFKKALPLCPNLKFVVLEQIGTGLQSPESRIDFQKDYERMCTLKNAFLTTKKIESYNNFLPIQIIEMGHPIIDETLYRQQVDLSTILETSKDHETAHALLSVSSLASSAWEVEKWTPYMLETALAIAQKWKVVA